MSLGIRHIHCANPECQVLNRVRAYSASQTPRCAACKWPLPEPAWMLWMKILSSSDIAFGLMLAGIGIVVIGFAFLDGYSSFGPIWNGIHGKINGVPYRYLFAGGVLVFLVGTFLRIRK